MEKYYKMNLLSLTFACQSPLGVAHHDLACQTKILTDSALKA